MEKILERSNSNLNYNIIILLFFITLFGSASGYSQDTSHFNYTAPLEIVPKITSNFGESRLPGFHFGIDIGTNEKVGQPVYSVADGFISRIKIEPGGYGKAIYINHANGTTSVYAHLQSVNEAFAIYVKDEQYKKESFYVDLIITPGQFTVKQKELIGYSGNSGLSSGPHLHFELRDTKTQDPINSLLSCYFSQDTFKPVIKKIWIYKQNNIINDEEKISYNVETNNGSYSIENNEIVELPIEAGIGIEAYDYISNNTRKLSLYSTKLYIDDILWFNIINDRIPFEQVSYVNSFIDFKEKSKSSINIVKQFVWPNQELIVYKTIRNKGLINFNDTLLHRIKIEVADKCGNTSILFFKAKKSSPLKNFTEYAKFDESKIIKWHKKTVIDSSFIKIIFPENSLYSDILFSLEHEDAKYDIPKYEKFLYSRGYKIGDNNIPLKKPFSVAFPLTAIPKNMYSKLFIAQIDKKNKVSYLGGKIENQYITSSARYFGKFALLIDTVAPLITPLNIKSGKNMAKEKDIRFKISDNLPELQNIKVLLTINGYYLNMMPRIIYSAILLILQELILIRKPIILFFQ